MQRRTDELFGIEFSLMEIVIGESPAMKVLQIMGYYRRAVN